MDWFLFMQFLETTYARHVGLLKGGFCVFDVINTVTLSAQLDQISAQICSTVNIGFSSDSFPCANGYISCILHRCYIPTPAFYTPAFSTNALCICIFHSRILSALREAVEWHRRLNKAERWWQRTDGIWTHVLDFFDDDATDERDANCRTSRLTTTPK